MPLVHLRVKIPAQAKLGRGNASRHSDDAVDCSGENSLRRASAGNVEIWYTQLGKTAYMNGATYVYAYAPAPGGGSLLNTTSGNYYMHKDWLGNARIVSSVPSAGNGAVSTDRAYAPYGEIYDIFGSTTQNEVMFTGDTQDVLAGIYDTPNRELQGSQQGRWLSPDPAGSGWNQYAYATNPNSFIDPSSLNLCPPKAICAPGDWYGGDGPVDNGLENTDFSAIGNSSSFCPICTGPYGFLGTAALSQGFFDFLLNSSGGTGIGEAGNGLVGNQFVSGIISGAGTEESPGFMYAEVWAPYWVNQPGAIAANNGPSWWGTFFSTLGNGLLHGVRQPGQSFTECVNQNVSNTTFGTVDPQKLFNQGLNVAEETAALLTATNLRTAVGPSVPVGPYVAGQLARLAGLGSTGTAVAIRAAAAGGTTLAVAGAATAGAAIGSAINCR